MIQLVRPTEERKEQALEFKQEFFDHGEFVINGSELFDKTDDYTEWCRAIDANTKEETVNPDWVVTDTFHGSRGMDTRTFCWMHVSATIKRKGKRGL